MRAEPETSPGAEREGAHGPEAPPRRYESPLRRQQAAQTRADIVMAGAGIAHLLGSWDWRQLTFRAVAERAGVSVRTVHRHFPDERSLREAILQCLVEESGVRLDRLDIGEFANTAVGVFRYLASFSTRTPGVEEPSMAALDRQRRQALLDAVGRAATHWPARQREMAAAMLDMLWNPASHERLSSAWRLDTEQATQAIAWIADLIEQAIRADRGPGR